MANIDLNKLFVNRFTTTSPVDSDINLNKQQGPDILFSDFKLDLKLEENGDRALNSLKTKNDLEKIVNEESILNSLRNILSTKFYSRLLNPEMNFDLRSYLFENITEHKAFFIGYDILSYIPAYEPRVSIKNISVTAYPDNATYSINLDIYIPIIDKDVKLSSILNSEGISYS